MIPIQKDFLEFVPGEVVGPHNSFGATEAYVQSVYDNDLTEKESANLVLALADLLGVVVAREPLGRTLVLTKKDGALEPCGASKTKSH